MHNVIESLSQQLRDINSIKPDPHNARLHPQPNLEAIKRSLETYGQRKPIVVNSRTGIIEAGNGLWQAAKELGWDEIAVVMVEDNPETAIGFAIMDNQSALLAKWDLPVLRDLLQDIDTGAFDMNLTGFDEKAIEDLMTQFHFDQVTPTQKELDDRTIELGERFKARSGKEFIKLICPECGAEFQIRADEIGKESTT